MKTGLKFFTVFMLVFALASCGNKKDNENAENTSVDEAGANDNDTDTSGTDDSGNGGY